jgi:DNA-binding NtrC family response regulator
MQRGRPEEGSQRPVLYQICRSGERFEVGDGPFDLSRVKSLVLGRGSEGGYDARGPDEVLRVDDPWMSSRHARIDREGTDRVVRDMGSTNGVLVNGKASREARLEDGDLVETGRTFWLFQLVPVEPPLPVDPVEVGAMATWNPALGEQFLALRKAARQGIHVLLRGERGVGKATWARVVHDVSGRRGRLVTVDCTSGAKEQLARQLLGDTEAASGALASADGGTVFLSRVDMLPIELQAALAGVLETGRVTPLAGGRPLPVELKLVASTESDLETATRKGRFARSLYDRLNGLSVVLPPLRERREDLGHIMEGLLARAEGARSMTRDACRALCIYRWPRNIRELGKVLEGAAILAGEEEPVDLQHLPGVVAARSGRAEAVDPTMTAEMAQVPAHRRGPEEEPPEEEPPRVRRGREDRPAEDDGGPRERRGREARPGDVEVQEEPRVPRRGREVPRPSPADDPPPRRGRHPAPRDDDVDDLPPREPYDDDRTERVQRPVERPARRATASAFERPPVPPPPPPPRRESRPSREDPSEREVVAELKRARGSVTAAARAMGLTRADLLHLLQVYDLDPADYG